MPTVPIEPAYLTSIVRLVESVTNRVASSGGMNKDDKLFIFTKNKQIANICLTILQVRIPGVKP